MAAMKPPYDEFDRDVTVYLCCLSFASLLWIATIVYILGTR